MDYKNNLRVVRQNAGMSISELARRVDSTRQTITSIELYGQEPSVKLGLKIALALQVDPYEIFFNNFVIQGLQRG